MSNQNINSPGHFPPQKHQITQNANVVRFFFYVVMLVRPRNSTGCLFAIYNNQTHVNLLRFTKILIEEFKRPHKKTSTFPPRITMKANRAGWLNCNIVYTLVFD